MNHQNRSSRTYIALREERIAGYFTLPNGSVSRDEVPARVAQGLGRYPVPITLLARLAVDASGLVGSRAIVTHAKDEAAKNFYRKFQFAPSPLNEFHLYLLMKDVRAIFGS